MNSAGLLTRLDHKALGMALRVACLRFAALVLTLSFASCTREESASAAPPISEVFSDKPHVEAKIPEGVVHELAGTRWVPSTLGEQRVLVGDNEREPFIVLNASEYTVSGYAGCNRLVGGYQHTDSTLMFTELATTRMACPQLEQEAALLKALHAVASFSIVGADLELFDASGARLALLEARNL